MLPSLQGHADWVRSVAISSDSRTIVSGSDDKTVRVWDAASGQCTAVLKVGHVLQRSRCLHIYWE